MIPVPPTLITIRVSRLSEPFEARFVGRLVDVETIQWVGPITGTAPCAIAHRLSPPAIKSKVAAKDALGPLQVMPTRAAVGPPSPKLMG